MVKVISKKCARCHKEIVNEPYELESDTRGVIRHIYHKRCVIIRGEKTPLDTAKIGE